MAYLFVSNKTDFGKTERACFDNVNVEEEACSLYKSVIEKFGVLPEDTVLIYRGKCIKEDAKLDSYGIKAGVTLHLMKRPGKPKTPEHSQAEIDNLLSLFSGYWRTQFLRQLPNLNKADVMENLIAVTPGLTEDPIALAILSSRDVALLTTLTEPTNVHKLVKAHPCLVEAFQYIASLVQAAENDRQHPLNLSTPQAGPSSQYSLDAMSGSDDEDLDSESQDQPLSQPITPAQLASALASVVYGASGSSANSSVLSFPGTPVRPSTEAGSAAEQASAATSITPEILSLAVRDALNAATGQATPVSTPQSAAPATTATVITEEQLANLRDMGIADDSRSRRALEMSGGDIQAAIDLLFGGMLDEAPPRQ